MSYLGRGSSETSRKITEREDLHRKYEDEEELRQQRQNKLLGKEEEQPSINLSSSSEKIPPVLTINVCLAILIFSIASYFYMIIDGYFDFGFVFEIVSLIFVLIARKNFFNNKFTTYQIFTAFAIFPLIILLFGDFAVCMINYSEDFVMGFVNFIIDDLLLLLTFALLLYIVIGPNVSNSNIQDKDFNDNNITENTNSTNSFLGKDE